MWELIQSNKRKSFWLILLLAAVLAGLGYAIGASVDPDVGGSLGLLAAVVIWTIMMLTNLLAGEQILLASAGARELNREEAPQLFNIVEEMNIASGLPVLPRVYLIGSDTPNAFAVGLNSKRAAVAVTTGLLSRLNRDELQGVIAHELGHISNRDTLFMTLAGVTLGAVILLADLYLRGMFRAGRSRRSSKSEGQLAAIMIIVALVLAILAPLLARLLYFACSRRREYLADASAAQFTRYPEGLASALEKIALQPGGRLEVSRALAPMFIVNPLAAHGSALSLFSTHPATEDRIRVLRGMASGSSLAAYEEAFRSAHGNRGIVGARSLQGAEETGIRAPTAEPPPVPGAQRREARDLQHKANGLSVVTCPCGVRFKIPPGFPDPSFNCPRCGTRHEIPGKQP